MKEIWKDIEGYKGFYRISNLGRVKSLKRLVKRNDGTVQKVREHILRLHIKDNGYCQVELRKNSKGKHLLVHRLVAEAFLSNPQNKEQVNHKDGNKLNNNVNNLEWVTCSENAVHAFSHNLRTVNKTYKLTPEERKYIKEHYVFRHPKYNSNALGKRFGVSGTTIMRIVNGKE